MKAIILAAGRGSRLKGFTSDKPKCLNVVNGKPLIEYQGKALRDAGVNEVVIVTGYMRDKLEPYADKEITNERWAETNMVKSLLCAAEEFNETIVISYSDILYDTTVVKELIKSKEDFSVVYDLEWSDLWSKRFDNPLDDAETFKINDDEVITEIGLKPNSMEEVEGQYIGLLKFTPKALEKITAYTSSLPPEKLDRLDMTSLLRSLIESGETIKGLPIKGGWFEVDTVTDLNLVNQLVESKELSFNL